MIGTGSIFFASLSVYLRYWDVEPTQDRVKEDSSCFYPGTILSHQKDALFESSHILKALVKDIRSLKGMVFWKISLKKETENQPWYWGHAHPDLQPTIDALLAGEVNDEMFDQMAEGLAALDESIEWTRRSRRWWWWRNWPK